MAPEIYVNRVPFDSEVIDVWSAGCVLWSMVTGGASYEVPLRTCQQFRYMTTRLPELLAHNGFHLSPDCVHLMQNIFQVDARLRLNIDEVLQHPWMQQG